MLDVRPLFNVDEVSMGDDDIHRLADSIIHVTDVADIMALPRATEVVMISQMDDDKAFAATSLHSLRVLFTDGNNRTTDQGLKALIGISTLRSLDLEWSDVTDDGIASLAALGNLEFLDLGGCHRVSEAAVQTLSLLLPKCEIVHWGDYAGPRSN